MFFIIACTVYEEDTFVSLLKPEQRLTGAWKLEKIEKQGDDITKNYFSINRINITEFRYNETYESYYNDSTVSYGIWYLIEAPENQLIIQPVGSWDYPEYYIRRLQSKHLWLLGYSEDFMDSLLWLYSNLDMI